MSKLSRSLLEPINTNTIILLGLYTILWGFWLLSPTWDVFTSAALFTQMHSLAPEWVWGGIAVTCGIATSYGVWRPSYKTLTFGAFIGAIHWLNVAMMYFLGDWTNTGGITALTFATYAAYVYVNIRVNKLGGDHSAKKNSSVE